MSKGLSGEQKQKITKLQLELGKFRTSNELADISRHEAQTPRNYQHNYNSATSGWVSHWACRAYSTLLDCYHVLNLKELSPERQQNIEKNIKVLTEMAASSKVLRKIEKSGNVGVYDEAKRGELPYSKDLDAYVKGKYEQLEKEGETYIQGGVQRHFEIVKISKVEKSPGVYEYHKTIYNAGFESPKVSEDGETVLGTTERKIKDTAANKEGLIDLMLTETEKAIHEHEGEGNEESYKKLTQKVENFLEEGIVRGREVSRQHQNNCPSRGIREFLRDNSDAQDFDKIYSFATYMGYPVIDSISKDLKGLLETDDFKPETNFPDKPKEPITMRAVEKRDPGATGMSRFASRGTTSGHSLH
jgi:hypothetical protein